MSRASVFDVQLILNTTITMSGNPMSAGSIMSLRCLILMFATGLGTCLPQYDCVAQDAAGGPRPDRQAESIPIQVRQLIEQLDSPRRRERVAAERALEQLGPEILDELPAAELIDSESVRAAVRRLRIRLEQVAATRNLEPARVQISEPMPLAKLIQQLTAQSGNAIQAIELPGETLNRSVKLPPNEITFWQAISTIEQQLAVSCEFNSTGQLQVLPEPTSALAVANETAFRVRVVRLSRRGRITEGTQSKLRLVVKVDAEPRLRPLFLNFNGTSLRLEPSTNSGTRSQPLPSLLPSAATFEFPMGITRPTVSLEQDFLIDPREQTERFDLFGELRIEVAAGIRRFSFREADAASERLIRRGAVSVRLLSWMAESDSCQVQILVNYGDDGPAFESHRTWVLHNAVSMRDQTGHQLSTLASPELTAQAGGSVELSYQFANGDVAAADPEFVYEAPTLITSVPLPFQFRDLTASDTRRDQPAPEKDPR